MRDRDIFNAIRSVLDATDAFDKVILWGLKDSSSEGSELTRAVAILPIGGRESDLFDGVPSATMFVDRRCRLVIQARDEDPQTRDEAADRLLSVCRNALNGAALNAALGQAVVYPQWTKVVEDQWKEAAPPQRDIEAIFAYRVDAATWDGFDTSA